MLTDASATAVDVASCDGEAGSGNLGTESASADGPHGAIAGQAWPGDAALDAPWLWPASATAGTPELWDSSVRCSSCPSTWFAWGPPPIRTRLARCGRLTRKRRGVGKSIGARLPGPRAASPEDPTVSTAPRPRRDWAGDVAKGSLCRWAETSSVSEVVPSGSDDGPGDGGEIRILGSRWFLVSKGCPRAWGSNFSGDERCRCRQRLSYSLTSAAVRARTVGFNRNMLAEKGFAKGGDLHHGYFTMLGGAVFPRSWFGVVRLLRVIHLHL